MRHLFAFLFLLAAVPAAPASPIPQVLVRPSAAGDAFDFDGFGTALALDGDRLVVQAYSDDVGARFDVGSLRVFRLSAGQWQLEAKLVVPAGRLAYGVLAAKGDLIVSGTAVFQRTGGTWAFRESLQVPAPSFVGFHSGAAIDGDRVFIASTLESEPGVVLVFRCPVADACTLEQQIQAPDPQPGDRFGSAIVVRPDRVFVGAYAGGGPTGAGVHVFERNGTIGSLLQTIAPPPGSSDGGFGRSLALLDPDSLFVARPSVQTTSGTRGSVERYALVGGQWVHAQQLASDAGDACFGWSLAADAGALLVGSSDGGDQCAGRASLFRATGSDWTRSSWVDLPVAYRPEFGMAVALSGNRAVVGAPRESNYWAFAGAVHDYDVADGSFVQRQLLDMGRGRQSEFFGTAVAATRDWLVATASGERIDSTPRTWGSTLVHRRGESGWQLHSTLPNTVVVGTRQFGASAAIQDDLLLVGAWGTAGGGAVLPYHFDGNAWIAEPAIEPGVPLASFGAAIAIDGDSAIVGAPRRNGDDGAVHFYRRASGAWVPDGEFTGTTGNREVLGAGVAISGDLAAVGAPFSDNYRGAVRIYERVANAWVTGPRITPPDATFDFGRAVVLDGDDLFVGAPNDGGINGPGAIYAFHRSGPGWQFVAKTLYVQPAEYEYLGQRMALDGDRLLSGLPYIGAQGSIAEYARSGPTLTYRRTITPADDPSARYFGWSVALFPGGYATGQANRHGDEPFGAPNEGGVSASTDPLPLFADGFE